MSGAKDKADARILTERIEHWPSMVGWWRTSPVQGLTCSGPRPDDTGNVPHRINDGALVFIPGIPAGACYCEEHATRIVEAAAKLEALAGPAIDELKQAFESSQGEREIVARERLAAAAERFANSFESLVNPMVRYIKHITRNQ